MPENSPEPRFTRSPEYKSLYSDFYRTRLGNGEITLIFSKTRHDPGLNVSATSAEEQIEIVVSWASAKIISLQLAALIGAIEAEIGPIPTPDSLRVTTESEREIVRSLGLSARAE